MKNLIAQVLKMKNLVSYRADSVVSCELIRKSTGSVTLFAFDKGQGLSEHTAPFDALVYIIDGKAKIRIAGKAHQIKAGELIIMPANKPHALAATQKFKMALIMIRSQ